MRYSTRFIGFFLGLIGLILVLVVSNLNEQRDKDLQVETEQRRLREQLRQERLKNEQFRQHAQIRLDTHDVALGMDTKNTPSVLEGQSLERLDDGGEGSESSPLEDEDSYPPTGTGDY